MRRVRLLAFFCTFFVFASGPARSGDVTDGLTKFAAATLVIGQKNFTSSECDKGTGKPAKSTLCGPEGVAELGDKTLYITDTGNGRVLGFKNVPTKNGASAKFVLGQKNFSSSKKGDTSKSFNTPTAVFVAG